MTWTIFCLESERIEEVGKTLVEARTLMSMTLFPRLHVLVAGVIGKNISDDGMDSNVTGSISATCELLNVSFQGNLT